MSATTPRPVSSQPTWWNTQAAPLQGAQLVIVYALFAAAPIAVLLFGGGAVWAYVLWAPAAIFSIVWSKARARRDGAPPRSVKSDAKLGLIIGGVVGACVPIIGAVFNDDILENGAAWTGPLGLAVVALALATEPYTRRRYRRSFTTPAKRATTQTARHDEPAA